MNLIILEGDWVEKLRGMPDNSVHMSMTSPPYWALRSYLKNGDPLKVHELGSEKTPEEYIAKMVAGFRELRRVLRHDGTLWMNLGDSYAGAGGTSPQSGLKALSDKWSPRSNKRANHRYATQADMRTKRADTKGIKLPAKNLMMMPQRVAMAMQEDGWILRSMMPWIKRNPMPESCVDRPTSAIEYIFLFSKSERYFYDGQAVKRASSPGTHARVSQATLQSQTGGSKQEEYLANGDNVGKKHRDRTPSQILRHMGRKLGTRKEGIKNNDNWEESHTGLVSARNYRNSDPFFDSWQGMMLDDNDDPLAFLVNTHGYSGAHFATYPPKLVKPAILAGTSAAGCCPACGAPFVRMVEDGAPDLKHQKACGGDAQGEYSGQSTKDYAGGKAQDASATKARILAGMVAKMTVAWLPGCNCAKDPVPCTVLDPFAGSFTTCEVAIGLGRNAIAIELNPEYIELGKKRCHFTDDDLLFSKTNNQG